MNGLHSKALKKAKVFLKTAKMEYLKILARKVIKDLEKWDEMYYITPRDIRQTLEANVTKDLDKNTKITMKLIVERITR